MDSEHTERLCAVRWDHFIQGNPSQRVLWNEGNASQGRVSLRTDWIHLARLPLAAGFQFLCANFFSSWVEHVGGCSEESVLPSN